MDLFPERKASAMKISVSVWGNWFDAVPCCHGASVVFLGVSKLTIALVLGTLLGES